MTHNQLTTFTLFYIGLIARFFKK